MIWHPVEQRKPPKAGRYLVVELTAEPFVASYTKRHGFIEDDGSTLNPWVTHWMELPKRPDPKSGGGQ